LAASVIGYAHQLRADRLRAIQGPGPCVETTLLELVQALADVTEDDREVVAAVIDLLRSGRVRLTGTFRSQPLTLG
jgi:hypothetical protein